jgi:hypothetical protein
MRTTLQPIDDMASNAAMKMDEETLQRRGTPVIKTAKI